MSRPVITIQTHSRRTGKRAPVTATTASMTRAAVPARNAAMVSGSEYSAAIAVARHEPPQAMTDAPRNAYAPARPLKTLALTPV